MGNEEFRVFGKRSGRDHILLGGVATLGPATKPVKHWNGMVSEVTWDDASALMGGSITLQRPSDEPRTPDVMDGDEIRLEYRMNDSSPWRELWTMRCYEPNYDFAAGTITFQLANDVGLLDASEDDFVYQKTKKKPNGWLIHDAMKDVCRRYGIPAKIVRSQIRITKGGVSRGVSPWQFLKKLKNMEEAKSGRKLFWSYSNGTLYLKPVQRSQEMLILGPTLIAAALDKPRQSRFATAVTVRQAGWKEGQVQSGKKHRRTKPKKVYAKYQSSSAVRRYGFIHRIIYSPDATSRSDLMREGKRWVAAVIKPQRNFTFTHPGIPTLKRGHAVLLRLPDENLRALIFVSQLHFRIGGGEFYMDVTCTTDDPYVDDKDQKVIDKLTDSPRRSQRSGTKSRPKPGANTSRTAPKPHRKRNKDGQDLTRRYGGP